MNIKKGISLIILVITIIVMIILASVVITSVTDSDIINESYETVKTTNLQIVQELADNAFLEACAKGETTVEDPDQDGSKIGIRQYVQNYLIQNGIDITNYRLNIKENEVKVLKALTTVDSVPIPDGFVASNATGENKKNTGLVIYEGKEQVTDENVEAAKRTRNQYVWVPVDSKTFETTFVRRGQRETDFEITPDTELNTTLMAQTDLDEVSAMYESVKKYGGFYLARYEAGLDSQRTTNVSNKSNVSSKMGKYVFNYVSQAISMSNNSGGAIEIARSIYPNNEQNNTGVVSTLMYSVQFDTTCKWLLDTGAIDTENSMQLYGNFPDTIIPLESFNNGAKYTITPEKSNSYLDVSTSKTKGTKWLLTTGATQVTCTNNIYDLGGNVSEWTMEARQSTYRLSRGGMYNAWASINYRLTNVPQYSINTIGFRVALYIK